MAAFLNYAMSSAAQANLPGLGFGQVPTAVIQYSVQRALPLLSVDTSQGASWYFEPSAGVKFTGAVNNVFSGAKDSYVHTAAIQLILAAETKSNSTTLSSSGSSGSLNVSALNLTSQLSGIATLQGQVNQNNSQIAILTSIAIASLVFGISGLALALFATIRLMIVGSHGAGQHSVYPGSMSGGVSGSQSVKGAKGGSGSLGRENSIA